MVSKEGRKAKVRAGQMAKLVEWGSEPLQTGFSVIQVLCQSCWKMRLTDAVKTMHQRCLSDLLGALLESRNRRISLFCEGQALIYLEDKSFRPEK